MTTLYIDKTTDDSNPVDEIPSALNLSIQAMKMKAAIMDLKSYTRS